MRYNEPINLKLFTYENGTFTLQAIIDDYQEISFVHNLYEAGDFTIQINYNIPNAQLFQRGMFVQFGNDPYMFGEILKVTDSIGSDGKGSQIRTITGKDARYIFKRRIIKNLNNEENWIMTAKGEMCLRNLVRDQCGVYAEEKRRLPVTNLFPTPETAIGKEYSVAESYSNLYDTLVTIATQSEIGWRVKFDGALTLEVFEGNDLSDSVQFSTDFDSLANGTFSDSAESFANTIYVGGKGTGADRDIYEGEDAIAGESPAGLERYEAWDNQSSMTSEDEYEAEALAMLTQYGQTIDISGNGLAECPYVFKEQYNIGDIITLAFSGRSAKAQILSVTENWAFNQYGISFSFGKPQNDLNRQLQLILKQIQKASDKTETTSSVKYYTIPTDTEMPKSDVIYNTIGFTGTVGDSGATFKLYYDTEKTGAKNYHIWFKQLGGSGKLTLTTGVSGKANLELNAGTYVAIIYVDADGNVLSQGATPTTTIASGNTQPAESGAVAGAISTEVSNRNTAIENAINALDVESVGGSGKYISAISETDGKISATAENLDTTVTSGSNIPVTSGAVYSAIIEYIKRLDLSDDINVGLGESIDNLPDDAIRWYKVRNLDIGWRSQDGMILNIPWSNAYCFQIAVDDERNWMSIRSRSNGTWNNWEKVMLPSDLDTYFGNSNKYISYLNNQNLSGYLLLAEIHSNSNGNHDCGFSGVLTVSKSLFEINKIAFCGLVRGSGSSVHGTQFTVNNLLYGVSGVYDDLHATYETDGTDFCIRLYVELGSWLRYLVQFDGLYSGDVITPYPYTDIDFSFPLSVSSSMAGTEITKENKAFRFPDYARGNLHTDSSATSYTATEDCYVTWQWISGARTCHILLDGTAVGSDDFGAGIYIVSFAGYVKKGTVITKDDGSAISTQLLQVYGLK